MSFAFIENPRGQGLGDQAYLTSALEQPMSAGATFWDQAGGGVVESFGLGTAIRDFRTPPLDREQQLKRLDPYSVLRSTFGDDTESEPISREEYEASPAYRKEVPWEEGMTLARAASLAEQYDRRAVREFYSEKRPITAFLGTLAGSATDPINYIPIAGEVVVAANTVRFGRVAGRAVTSSADAMANTALFGALTEDQRAKFGDDVSWQATVSQIAMAGLIGGAFGAVHGRFGRTIDPELRTEAEASLATLENVQKSRVALNDAIDGMVNEGEVRLSEASTEYVDETAGLLADVYTTSPDGVYVRVPEEPMNLSRFVWSRGGVVDDGGDVRAILGRAQDRPGLISRNGSGLDDMALAAYEAGYFPELGGRPTVRQFLDKLESDLRGDRQFSVNDEGQSAAVRDARAWNDEIEQLANEYGIDPTGMSRAEFFDRVAEGQSIEDAATLARSRADATRAAFDEAEREMRDLVAKRGGVWDSDAVYGAPRTLEDLEYEYRQERASGNAFEGSGRAQAGRFAGGGEREVPPRGGASDAISGIAGRYGAEGRDGYAADALDDAKTRVGKPEASKAMAEQYRVNPETGEFPELDDLEQLRAEGRLTEDDIAALDAADETVANAKSFGEAVKAFGNCVI